MSNGKPSPDAWKQSVHQLWDKLADIEAVDADLALEELLATIGTLIDAQNAWWVPAVRMDDDNDPARGWRAPAIQYWKSLPENRMLYRRKARAIEEGNLAETSRRHIEQAGRFRGVLLRDHVPREFFSSTQFETHFAARGITDALYVVTPISRDSESYLCFQRLHHEAPFTKEHLAVATYAVRPLKAFQRQLFVSRGLLVGSRALTPVERRVLHELLTDKSEKQIAVSLGLAQSTTHKYVTSVYRKLGVSGRAGLTALWLNTLS